jgi:hypothetical protein
MLDAADIFIRFHYFHDIFFAAPLLMLIRRHAWLIFISFTLIAIRHCLLLLLISLHRHH